MPLSEEDIYNILCKIDSTKACGPDDIPGRLLKEGAPWLAEPLTKLFCLSLRTAELPSDWTSANVTPIYKKGSKHNPRNYRPVSLTCITIKVLERLVYNSVMSFLDEHNKLSVSQHGFRSGHSCQTQLLEVVHHWAQTLERRSSSHIVFLDFSKAFDTVPHERLLMKLDDIGVRGELLSWLRSFLMKRRQRVMAKGCTSDWATVSSGVPQGSILGPLLFLIYTNDIGGSVISHSRTFADDCAIYREVNSLDDVETLQDDLNEICRWSAAWQLQLNLSKCKVLQITNKKTSLAPAYNLNGVSLEWVDSFTYLGVVINKKLNWGDHIATKVAKANRMLGLLKRSMCGCSELAKKNAFVSLVRPHVEYCAPVWNPHLKDTDALEKIQKRGARWICCRWSQQSHSWSRTYEDACTHLGWKPLSTRRTILSCCQVYKIINNLDCICFDNYYSFNPSISTRSHSLSLFCIPSSINAFRFSFFVNSPFVWNSLPLDIVSAHSLPSFKYKLYKFF